MVHALFISGQKRCRDVLMEPDGNSLLCLSPDLLSSLLLDHERERGQPHEECARPGVLSSSGRKGPQQEGEEFSV